MRKLKDLRRKKFGKLTVISRNHHDKHKWDCLCDCGKRTIVSTHNLHATGTKSCGCSRIKNNKWKDYSGIKIKSWTVINRNIKRKGPSWFLKCECGRTKSFSIDKIINFDIPDCKNCDLIGKKFNRYSPLHSDSNKPENMVCKCDCGNIKSVATRDIVNGHIKSCGCLQKSKILDITNKKFGKMTALNKNIHNHTHWDCICDCGIKKTIRKSQLTNGATLDCGCVFEKEKNLIGRSFGNLIVISTHKAFNNRKEWECICLCGKTTYKTTTYLKNNQNPSCGCKNIHRRYQNIPETLKTLYYSIKQRCYNINTPIFKWYGGKGVIMCNEWLKDKELFYKWALSNGYDNELEIDRENGNGNYEPNNCRFITKTENLQNRPSRYNK